VAGRFEIDGTATPVPPARFNVTFTNGRLSIGDWKTEFSLRLLNPTGYVDITYLDGRSEISECERSAQSQNVEEGRSDCSGGRGRVGGRDVMGVLRGL
jgi:hypothetical protein